MKTQAILTGLRDLGCWSVGWGGIIYQQVTGRVEVALLLTYLCLLGVPGAIGLLRLRGSGVTPATPSSPSSSLSSSSSSPSG